MRNLLERFLHYSPNLYFVVVGIGGTAVIVGGLDMILYFGGGLKMMRGLGLISIFSGSAWLIAQMLKVKTFIWLRGRS